MGKERWIALPAVARHVSLELRKLVLGNYRLPASAGMTIKKGGMTIKKGGMAIKKVAMMGLLLLISFEAKAQCVMNQDCATLGYTKTAAECSGNGLKCPFGDKWSCPAKPLHVSCAIGWIYYSDGTCVTPEAHNTSKLALGVVVYLNPNGIGGQIMTANGIGYYYWSHSNATVPGLPSYNKYQMAMKDFDSCGNTDKIIAYGNSSTYPAAWTARNYTPTQETKGKWCIPAAGILSSVYINVSLVNAGITKLGGARMSVSADNDSPHVWSSTVYNYNYPWIYCVNRGASQAGLYNNSGKNDNGSSDNYLNLVRPVLEF